MQSNKISFKDFESILAFFLYWEKETPDAVFLRQPTGSEWRNYSWKEAGERARKVAGALTQSGCNKGDKVSILSVNCADWIICDLAIMMAGCISVPLYANVNSVAMRGILQHCDAKLLFLGKTSQENPQSLIQSIPDDIRVVTMPGIDQEGTTSWNEFIGNAEPASEIKLKADDVFTIIYTSGTTGDPKGVVQTHRSIINALKVVWETLLFDRHGNRFVSYLPLSHAAERGLIEVGGISCGGIIGFVESLDKFKDNVQSIQPTHFFGVPRIWEKIKVGIEKNISPSILKIMLRIPFIKSVIRSRVKKQLGLSEAEVILSGAAPISPDLLLWYSDLGINIREAYGLSEDFNVLAMNPVDDIRVGTVGKIFDEEDILIDPDTSEILQKSNWLMKEYFKDPELTSKTIVDGYLHTGDTGTLSDDGYLTVTGRLKDIFKTAKGKYIAPREYENKFLNLDIVDQACVMGSDYPRPFILLVLSGQARTDNKAEIESVLDNTMKDINTKMMEYERLDKVVVVNGEWTTDNGMLTPTLKMKRNVLTDRYEKALKPILEIDSSIVWEDDLLNGK